MSKKTFSGKVVVCSALTLISSKGLLAGKVILRIIANYYFHAFILSCNKMTGLRGSVH